MELPLHSLDMRELQLESRTIVVRRDSLLLCLMPRLRLGQSSILVESCIRDTYILWLAKLKIPLALVFLLPNLSAASAKV